jgi:hypothetical protein
MAREIIEEMNRIYPVKELEDGSLVLPNGKLVPAEIRRKAEKLMEASQNAMWSLKWSKTMSSWPARLKPVTMESLEALLEHLRRTRGSP